MLRFWDVGTGRELRNFVGHSGTVLSVAASPDGRFVLSGSADQTLKLWSFSGQA
jgi:WD40 repeat protein